MNQYPLWRYLLLIALLILGVIYALPNLYGDDPAIQIDSKSSTLNTDLQTKIKTALSQNSIAYLSMENEKNTLLIRFSDTDAQLKAQDLIQATLGPDFTVALNLASRTPKWLTQIGAHPMKLGLDLRGGIHFLLRVDTNALMKNTFQSAIRDFGLALRESHIRYTGMLDQGEKGVVIRFSNETERSHGLNLLKSKFNDYTWSSFQLLNQPALHALLTPQALIDLRNYAVDQNLTILRNRVNELGVAEPVIQRQGADHISVDLPGIQDTAHAKEIIGKVATINVYLVDWQQNPSAISNTGIVPIGDRLLRNNEGHPVLIKNQIILPGSSIIHAASSLDTQSGTPAVQVRIKSGDAMMFHRITSQNVGKPLATVYSELKTVKQIVNGKIVTSSREEEKVINVASINEPLSNSFIISGMESMDAAKNLALLLRAGAYTAPLEYVQSNVVGPSLGKDNIKMGITSIEIGALFVIVFMVLYYRGFGAIADMALILNIIFIVAILSLLGATLTLPGMAGIVLTVGMAVDANVLINERIREELRAGMSPQASIYAGYERAFSTIVDANVTSLIVMIVLLTLGSGPVENFAVNIIIGLCTSMVTAIFFTRAIVNLIYGRRHVKQLSIGIRVKS